MKSKNVFPLDAFKEKNLPVIFQLAWSLLGTFFLFSNIDFLILYFSDLYLWPTLYSFYPHYSADIYILQLLSSTVTTR